MTFTGRRQEALQELEHIGLSSYEARAYLALLTAQPANGYDLAREAGVPTSKIYETLHRLVAKGAALASASEPTLYRAVPPQDLITGFRRETERSLAILSVALPEIAVTPSPGVIWRLEGEQTILSQMQRIVAEATRELFLSIWPSEAASLVQPVELARRRGVRTWIATFGAGPFEGEGVYDLESCGTSSAGRLGRRLIVVVADDEQVLTAELGENAEPAGTMAIDPSLALVAREYIIHDLINHVLIEELGQDRFSALRSHNPMLSALLGPEVSESNNPTRPIWKAVT